MAKSVLEFTRRHYDDLKAAQRILNDLLPIIDKANACGMDCEAWRAIHAEMTNRLGMLEREFFSPPPT